MNVRICLDNTVYQAKPTKKQTSIINNKIASNEVEKDVSELSKYVGEYGHTWTPATFYNNKRSNDNFKCQQLFALDFDSGIAYKEIIERAQKYHIPITFIYETFSSINENRFRVVFMHYSIIDNNILAKYIQIALMAVFNECDRACKDISRMYYGGKKLLYVNDDSCFDFNDLTMSYVEFLKDKYGKKHYTKYIKSLAEETGVLLINGFPYITLTGDDNQNNNGDLDTFPIEQKPIIIRSVTKSPNAYYRIYFDRTKEKSFTTNKKIINISTGRRTLIRNFNWDSLYHKCELYQDFVEGHEWFYHPQLFGIATNLVQIAGGEKKFLEILYSGKNKDYPSYKEKDWTFYLNYFEKANYKAASCKSFCPYCDDCIHGKNMIDHSKIKRNEIIKIKQEKYVSIHEAEKCLERNFLDAQVAEDNLIHLIKAQTGLGKSTTYLKYLNNSDKPYIIAVPTNDLKNEILAKALSKGYNVIATPSLPEELPQNIKEKIDALYNIGASKNVIKVIKKIAKEENIQELIDYIDDLKSSYDFNGHIITTHARLLTFPPKMLDRYNIIIDEDIIRNLLKNEHVKIRDLNFILKSKTVAQAIKDRISDIICNQVNNTYKRVTPVTESFIQKDIEQMIGKNISSNVIDFLNAEVIYKCIKNECKLDDENVIYYLVRKRLPNKKVIIMSATADEELYYMHFGKDRVKVYNCSKAKYEGKLCQYYEKTCSRAFLSENEHYKKVIVDLTKQMNTITFKSYKSCFNITNELHFGNTEGHNSLEGKDIAIVGTPHLNELVYKMYGTALGINVNDEKLTYQQIENKNYKFWFMTYKNPVMRKIQLWLIESELEQCVGRARILRNNCNVFLFSNFPLEQADFIRYEKEDKSKIKK
jgi:hypothetical protein